MKTIETDFVVLGSGMAGLSYAIKAASHGRVMVITKKQDSDANTNYAQGGIAAVMDPLDSFEAHIKDTMEAGAGLCDPEAVALLVESGPDRVRELIAYGIDFTHRADDPSRLSLAREGGHSARRIVRADDATGRAIEHGLLEASNRAGVEMYEHFFAIDLLTAGSPGSLSCAGALVYDDQDREVIAVRARVTFLATGGCGQVYRFTTNPPIATGDGIAMAYRAGAEVANLEFIQFHPTGLYPIDEKPFLISETVRGEGAILRNLEGRAFIEAHGTSELAPRDVVARAIDAEMKASGAPHVWLDCSPIPPEVFAERFPTILETCRARGFDPPRDSLPVVPAAHYLCGGVRTDLWGRTSVHRLLAAGEVACTGVHGANRLASNSLLEAVVFAARAAEAAVPMLDERPEDPAMTSGSSASGSGDVADLRARIRQIMWEGAGIVRTDEGLMRARSELDDLRGGVPEFAREPDAVEARNMFMVAKLIVESALRREESRGLHYSLSHPENEDDQAVDTVLSLAEYDPLEP